jgi:hypothetical protein
MRVQFSAVGNMSSAFRTAITISRQRVAVITGASPGIVKETAKALAAQRADADSCTGPCWRWDSTSAVPAISMSPM